MKEVAEHYGKPGLVERVKEAIRQSGLDPAQMKQSDLAMLDQFHVGGVAATDELAKLAEIRASDRVLDLGSGVGGPSRQLAATIGCHVTGVDLTAEYCQVATMLAEATGLSRLVEYRQGNALHAPFEDAAFDVIWTQHASMNIGDKAGLYREMFRLLKPGGRLAIHDIVAGTGEVLFPVPWASKPEFSFLIGEQQMQDAVTAAGFQISVAQDVTKQGLEALRHVARGAGSPGYGIGTLIGPGFPAMAKNLIANLESGACCVFQLVGARHQG